MLLFYYFFLECQTRIFQFAPSRDRKESKAIMERFVGCALMKIFNVPDGNENSQTISGKTILKILSVVF